jgi:DNA-binding MarR family transcriptional regulator
MTSRAIGRENEGRVLEALAGVPCASPGELGDAASLPARTLSDVLGRLEARGLLTRTKAKVELTAEGRALATSLPSLAPLGSLDDAADELLPPWHAAWARLMADAVVARHAFPDRPLHPSFVAFGPSRTGKSTAVSFVLSILGLPDTGHVYQTSALTPGELLGRRTPTSGRDWVFEPSPLLDLELLCLDEYADADSDVRRAARKLLQGEAEVIAEGERVAVRPVVAVLFNPPPRSAPLPALLPPGIYRRAFSLDTSSVPDAMTKRSQPLRAFFAARRRRELDVAALLDSSVHQLSEGSVRLIAQLHDGPGHTPVTDAGLELLDPPKLELCALGRSRRWGVETSEDDVAATAAVVLDALTCLETLRGMIHPNWRRGLDRPEWESFLGAAPGAARFAATLRRGVEAQEGIADRIRTTRIARRAESLAVTRQRAELVEGLELARGLTVNLPKQLRPRAAGVREQLRLLARQAGDARSTEALDEIEVLAGPLRNEAASLRAVAARERAQEAAERDASRRDAQRERDEQRQRKDELARRQRAAKAATTRRVKELRKSRTALGRLLTRRMTRKREDVVSTLIAAGAVRMSTARTERIVDPLTIETMFAKALGRPAPAPRHVIAEQSVLVDCAGLTWRLSDVRQWGSPATRLVLERAVESIDQAIARAS